jgi:hypothetical protein
MASVHSSDLHYQAEKHSKTDIKNRQARRSTVGEMTVFAPD